MKTMALMLSLLAAGLGASFALASPGHGHGHGKSDSTTAASTTATTQARACRPTVAYVLNGTFVAAGADGSSFSMKVTPCEPPCEGPRLLAGAVGRREDADRPKREESGPLPISRQAIG